jgi:hypothetical protein
VSAFIWLIYNNFYFWSRLIIDAYIGQLR